MSEAEIAVSKRNTRRSGSKALGTPDYSVRLPYFATALSLVLILAAVSLNNSTERLVQQDVERSEKLNALANELYYFDEVLTTSAHMAAYSNSERWKQRYDETAPLLEASIIEAMNSMTESSLQSLKKVNELLMYEEAQLFDLIAAGNKIRALDIIEGERYAQLNLAYGQSLSQLSLSLQQQAQQSVKKIAQREKEARWIKRSGLLVLLCVWFIVGRNYQQLRRELEQNNLELISYAHFDGLTGIPNRNLFLDRLSSSLSESKRNGSKGALLLIDLDNFKSINDALGHPLGDKLLEVVAQRFVEVCRESDTVARLGGDEFAIIVKDTLHPEQTIKLIQKIQQALKLPAVIDNHNILTCVSIGVATFPGDAYQQDELLRKADMALYKAKALGRNTYAYFDEELERVVQQRRRLEGEIQLGIENEEFFLHYQPIIDLQNNCIVGVEALVRWRHPRQGMVSPIDFIPVAEESRLIVPLGNWVLEQAFKDHIWWQAQSLPPLNMSVNLSAVQFEDPSLFKEIEQKIAKYMIDPSNLTLEITETTLLSATHNSRQVEEAIAVMHELDRMGIKIAIDDFGTGYSSLAYLKRFPIHHLKIDRMFIDGLPDDTEDIAITQAILNLSAALNLKVVAEGIETSQQLQFLQNENCHFAQGFYLGKPMPADEFMDFYHSFNGNDSEQVLPKVS